MTRNGKDQDLLEGHASQVFEFKNGSGATAFSFARTAEPDDFAEGMADAIHFLARHAQQSIEPRVFSMVEVARREALV